MEATRVKTSTPVLIGAVNTSKKSDWAQMKVPLLGVSLEVKISVAQATELKPHIGKLALMELQLNPKPFENGIDFELVTYKLDGAK
jgi:hypothetical protein